MLVKEFYYSWLRLGKCFSNNDLCRECDLCETGQIHVFPQEIALLESVSPEYVKLDGIVYIKKTNSYCPYYELQRQECKIYELRPLCCRLFPLDVIITESGVLSWVAFKKCPIIKELILESKLDWLYFYVESIERMLPEGMGTIFRKYSEALYHLENWLGDKYDYYVIKPFLERSYKNISAETCKCKDIALPTKTPLNVESVVERQVDGT